MYKSRQYKLMRVSIRRFPIKVLVFDFWNKDEQTGYEIQVQIKRDINKALKIAGHYVLKTHTIVAWDELITCIKAEIIEDR